MLTLAGRNYILALDYYSHFPEIALLQDTASKWMILLMKSIFASHGITGIIKSGNGPQFTVHEFKYFVMKHG